MWPPPFLCKNLGSDCAWLWLNSVHLSWIGFAFIDLDWFWLILLDLNWFCVPLRMFFFKQKTAYEIGVRLVGSEMCIRDRTAPVASGHGWFRMWLPPFLCKKLGSDCDRLWLNSVHLSWIGLAFIDLDWFWLILVDLSLVAVPYDYFSMILNDVG